MLGALFKDVKFAFRMMRKAPGFTAVAVLSLALGIGPNTAIFSLVDTVLLQEWGVAEPESLVDVYSLTDDGRHFQSYRYIYELVDEGAPDIFEEVTSYTMQTVIFQQGDGRGEMVLGEMVTGNYFEVMGVPAARGRTFSPEEDATPGTHPVLVLSDRYWRARYDADPGVVGGEVRINGRPYTVIGVAPGTFKGRIAPGVGSDFWVPMSMYPHLSPTQPNQGNLLISGRLRDGVTAAQAEAAVNTVATRYNEERLAENPDRQFRLELATVSVAEVRLNPDFDQIVMAMAGLLFVAVGLVLLVACVNLAGFFLARATDRRKEMAVRVAMGAGKRTILRQLLVESVVLAFLGGAVGLFLGILATRLLVGIDPPMEIPLNLEAGLNARVFFFTGLATAIATLIFGLTPALEATRAPVASTLRDEAGSSGGVKKAWVRKSLVGAQMTLSTVLLVGAGLFLRSLKEASEITVGFDTGPAAVVNVESWASEYTPEEMDVFVEDVLRFVRSEPGVTAAGVTARLPLDLGTINNSMTIPGVDPPPGRDRHTMEFTTVTPGYFEAMGIRLLEGRTIEENDRDGTPDVAVVTQAVAERYWPGESAIGRTVYYGGDEGTPVTIVGVVENTKIWSLTEPPRPYFYLPWDQKASFGSFHVVARGNTPAPQLAARIRDEALRIDPDLYLSRVGTLDDHLDYIFFLPRMAAVLLSIAGILALVLACVGLYGMVSYAVARRTREMGIRMALGAEQASVVTMLVKGGLSLVVIGGVFGLGAAAGLGVLAQRFLIGVAGMDPVSLLGAPFVLGAAALMAAYLPARRASRVNPVEALRTE